MSAALSSVPAIQKHMRGNTVYARIWLKGRGWVYLGRWGTRQVQREYDAAVAAWLAAQRQACPVMVNELIARFMTEHAAGEYKASAHNGEAVNYKYALRPVQRFWGKLPADHFGPAHLAKVRDAMVKLGWRHTHINRCLGRVRFVFRWAASEGLIGAEIHAALKLTLPARKGRPGITASRKVKPAPPASIEAVRKVVTETVRDMIDMLLLTGMRIGELCVMTRSALDTSRKPWLYTLVDHKTAHHEEVGALQIPLGPGAREIVQRHLTMQLHAPVFRNTRGRPYNARSFRKRIVAGCAEAGVEEFTTHQLRHTAGTEARIRWGADGTKARLRQRSTAVAEGYGDLEPLAIEIAEAIG